MALSLGWHIVIACFGVGMPALVLIAEWRGQRTGDPACRLLARRWARAMGVLFAVGAVSGTILSFEMGVLRPGLMSTYGEVIGLPFALEGIAFFIEAIFLGIWLYAWDRVPGRARLLVGLPVLLAGTASAFFVVTANAWTNQPVEPSRTARRPSSTATGTARTRGVRPHVRAPGQQGGEHRHPSDHAGGECCPSRGSA